MVGHWSFIQVREKTDNRWKGSMGTKQLLSTASHIFSSVFNSQQLSLESRGESKVDCSVTAHSLLYTSTHDQRK